MIRSKRANGKEAEVSVVDSGAGIPAEMLPRIFDPFVTSKSTGMGLGLSISRTIVEAHGGQIRAENVPAGGAAFHFTLPFASAAAPVTRGRWHRACHRRRRVLAHVGAAIAVGRRISGRAL